MKHGCGADIFTSEPSTRSYLHLLDTPLSNIWQYSEASYQAWTEELLGYERRRIMKEESREDEEEPYLDDYDYDYDYDYDDNDDDDDYDEEEEEEEYQDVMKQEWEEDSDYKKEEGGEEKEQRAPLMDEQNFHQVLEEVERLELESDGNQRHRHHKQAETTTTTTTRGTDQTAVLEECLGCPEQNQSGNHGGLWGLYCGHTFHPDCLRRHLRTCWQTCQPRDNNPVFVCPKCGDQLDSTWCGALIGSAGCFS